MAYTSGTWRYDISASLGSGATFTSQTPTTATGVVDRLDAKAVVGAPVAGTISYKLTNTSSNLVYVDLTISVDLGTLTANAGYVVP
jgi:hypothetical protein